MNSKKEKEKDKNNKSNLNKWTNIGKSKAKSYENNHANKMKGDNKKTISEEFLMEDDWDSTNEKLYMQNILDQSWIKKK